MPSDPPPNRPASPVPSIAYQPLVVVLMAACAGIFSDRWFEVPAAAWLIVSLSGLMVWLFLWRCRHENAAALLLLAATASTAALWHQCRWQWFPAEEIGRYAQMVDEPVALIGVVTQGVEYQLAEPHDPLRAIPATDGSRVELEVLAIRDDRHWRPVSGRTLASVQGELLGLRAGDRILIFGQLSQPPHALNPGQFDSARHHRADRRLAGVRSAFPDCVSVIGRTSPWHPRWLFSELRRRANRMLWRYLDSDQAGLASAVLLGLRDSVGRERTEAFMETGTIHLLAISGLHVAILAGGLALLVRFGWSSPRWGLGSIALLAVFYALMTEARPPVLRASMLVVVLCVALWSGRRPRGWNALAAAGLVVLIWNPAELFGVGAQLSFLAVATLIAAGPLWTHWIGRDALTLLVARTRPWPHRAARAVGHWFWRLTLMGLAVWAVSLPLVLHHFHVVSPTGIVGTPILYVPLAVSLISGLGVLLFGWLLPPVAHLFAEICDLSLWTLDRLVAFFHSLPAGHGWLPGPDAWWLAGFYGGLAVFLLLRGRDRLPVRWAAALLAAWIAIGVAGSMVQRRGGELQCSFLAVGHGCSVLLELPDGKTVLYDAGRLGSHEAGAHWTASYLWHRGITHLDAVIISHADADHYNALPPLLEKISVGVVYITPAMREAAAEASPGSALTALFAALDRHDVPVREIYQGDHLATRGASLEVFHPPQKGVLAPDLSSLDNANSLVLAVEFQGRRILLTGDLESPGLDDVMAELPWHCDVVLAPHHGSPRSNPPGFAAWCRPGWTVISGGRQSLTETTVQEAYQAAGSRVLHTAHEGCVQVQIGTAGELTVNCHRPLGGT